MTINISPRDLESLSAYLDGQLSAKERTRLEGKLQADADLRATLEDLRRIRTLLRRQPKPRAPRNFTLTGAMLGERPRKSVGFSLFPALRLASVLASFAFVAVILSELLLGGRPTAGPLIAAQAPAPAAREMQSEAQPSPGAAESGPADQAVSTEAIALLEATPATPDFPVDVPPQTFSEEPPGAARPAGGGGAPPGLGGGDGTVEEPLLEEVEETPLAEEALSFSMVITPSETLAAPTEAPLAMAPAPGENSLEMTAKEAPAAPASGWSVWRWVQVILAILALAAGSLAFYLRRTGRA